MEGENPLVFECVTNEFISPAQWKEREQIKFLLLFLCLLNGESFF